MLVRIVGMGMGLYMCGGDEGGMGEMRMGWGT
jgi:hypothetical protein